LIGDSVHATYRFPDFTTVDIDGGTQTIATGTVFSFDDLVTITFSASEITITTEVTGFNPYDPFNGPDLAFLSGPAITNVTEDSASTPSFATGSVLSFGANDINVNLGGTCATRCVVGEKIILDVTTAGASSVPEPSTWAMMLIGFAGLAFAGRRARGGFRLAA
jgi:PEP-CTERM motif